MTILSLIWESLYHGKTVFVLRWDPVFSKGYSKIQCILSGLCRQCSIVSICFFLQAPTPGPYVKEMSDAGQFYGNRVIKDFKEK